MLDIKQRNRKIFHLIEIAIHDFCKVLGTSYYTKEGAIMVQHENEDLFYLYLEFHQHSYKININCLVFQDLTMSKTAKLKEVYRLDGVADYLSEAEASLWFLDDTRLVLSHVFEAQYSDYAILKSKMLLEAYINVQNARMLKDKLELLLTQLEQVSVN